MITAIGDILENFDLNGKSLKFRFNKSTGIKTSCGGINVILTIFCILFIILFYFIPFMERKYPIHSYFMERSATPDRFNLTNEYFFIALDIKSKIDSREVELSLNPYNYLTLKAVNYFFDSQKNLSISKGNFIYLYHIFIDIKS